jgi:hypothetical protein
VIAKKREAKAGRFEEMKSQADENRHMGCSMDKD